MTQYLIDDSMFEFYSDVPDYTDYSWLLQNPLPPGAIIMRDPNQDLDTWVRLHLWPAMGIEPRASDYSALIRAKKLFGQEVGE